MMLVVMVPLARCTVAVVVSPQPRQLKVRIKMGQCSQLATCVMDPV